MPTIVWNGRGGTLVRESLHVTETNRGTAPSCRNYFALQIDDYYFET